MENNEAVEILKQFLFNAEDCRLNKKYMIFVGDTDIQALQTLISLAQLFLSVKGAPEKKKWLPKNDLDNLEVKGYNDCHDKFTAWLVGRVEGLV